MFGKSQTKRFNSPCREDSHLGPGCYDVDSAWDGVLKSNAYQRMSLATQEYEKENVAQQQQLHPSITDNDNIRLRKRLRNAILERDQMKLKLTDQLAARNFKVSTLRKQLQDAIERENVNLQKNETENQKHSEELQRLSQEKSKLEFVVDGLQTELQSAKQLATEQNEEIMTLRETQQCNEVELQKVNSKYESLTETNFQLKMQLSDTHQRLLDSENDSAHWMKKSQSLEHQTAKLKEELCQCQLQLSKSNSNFHCQESEVKKLSDAILELQQSNSEVQHSLKSVTNLKDRIKEELTQQQIKNSEILKERLEIENQRYFEMKENFIATESKCVTLENNHQELKARCERQKNNLLNCLGAVSNLENQVNKLVTYMVRLETHHSVYRKEVEATISEKAEMVKTLEVVLSENDKSMRKADTLLQEKENIIRTSNALIKRELQSSFQTIDRTIDLISQRMNSEVLEHAQKESENEILSKKIELLFDERKTYQIECTHLENTVAKLDESLHRAHDEIRQSRFAYQAMGKCFDVRSASWKRKCMELANASEEQRLEHCKLLLSNDELREELNILHRERDLIAVQLEEHEKSIMEKLPMKMISKEDVSLLLETMQTLYLEQHSEMNCNPPIFFDNCVFMDWLDERKTRMIDHIEFNRHQETSKQQLSKLQLELDNSKAVVQNQQRAIQDYETRIADLEQLVCDGNELKLASKETIDGLTSTIESMAVHNAQNLHQCEEYKSLSETYESELEKLKEELSRTKSLLSQVHQNTFSGLDEQVLNNFIRGETRELVEENAKLAGHTNNKQKIHIWKRVRAENLKLKQEKLQLKSQVETLRKQLKR